MIVGLFSLPKIRREENSKTDIPAFKSQNLTNEVIFSTLFDYHPDAVFTILSNRKINFYNPSLIETFGFSESNLEKEFDKYIFNPVIEKYFEFALNGQSQSFVGSVENPAGRKFDLDITLVPLMDSDMKVVAVYGIAKDVTVYFEYEKEIKDIINKFELAQKVGKISTWEYNIETGEIFLSAQVFELLGRGKHESHKSTVDEGVEYIYPEDREKYRETFFQAIANGEGYSIEYRILRKDNTVVYVSENVEIIRDENGKPERLIGNTQDITKRKLAEMKLQDTKMHVEHIYHNLSLGIDSYDVVKGETILVTPGVGEITGYPLEVFYGKGFWETILHPEDVRTYKENYEQLLNGKSYDIQYRLYHKNGHIVWVQDKCLPILDEKGNVIRIDGIVTNISAQKEAEEKIHQLAYYDMLTGLPNNTLFYRKIEELIEINEKFAVMHLDLDRFRNINDTIGHKIGDLVLKQFCHRMNELLIDSSLFARVNGDEFGFVLWNYEPSDFPESIAKTIIDSLKEPFKVADYELYLNASIGICTYPSNGSTLEELINNTNNALYRAKATGKNNYGIYSSTLNIPSFKKYELERDLRKSIERKELVVYFQPRVDTMTGKIVSAEALTRWLHPEWGLVSPGEFIPIAEESGFIDELGDWVINEVCQRISKWKQEELNIVPISINISAQRFLKSDWVTMLLRTLKENDVEPTLIELEITETTLIQHEKEVQFAIQYLKDLGVKVALDDFGTGFSSLTHLKDFAINTIKIDRSFVSQIAKTPNVEIIIKSLIFMARGLEMNVVAEGVETIEQLEFLRQQECAEIQGYVFCKAVPADTFESLLKMMVLKPEMNHEKIEREERRVFYRVDLLLPLSTEMTLTSFKGRVLNLGKTEVVIDNIGGGGLRFLSTIQLPVRPDMTYQFETTILNHKINVSGHIVWKAEDKEGTYQYGVQFTINENERCNLLGILNKFSLQLKSTILVPDCDFIREDKYHYLKTVNRTT